MLRRRRSRCQRFLVECHCLVERGTKIAHVETVPSFYGASTRTLVRAFYPYRCEKNHRTKHNTQKLDFGVSYLSFLPQSSLVELGAT